MGRNFDYFSDEDEIYSDEDLPIISVVTNRLITRSQSNNLTDVSKADLEVPVVTINSVSEKNTTIPLPQLKLKLNEKTEILSGQIEHVLALSPSEKARNAMSNLVEKKEIANKETPIQPLADHDQNIKKPVENKELLHQKGANANLGQKKISSTSLDATNSIALNKEAWPPSVSSLNVSFEEIKNIIQRMKFIDFPTPSSLSEQNSLVFLCQLFETFQGSIAIRFSEIPPTFSQIHGKPLEYKRHVLGMKSLLSRMKSIPTIKEKIWKKAASKFRYFIMLLPWFSIYFLPANPNYIWVLRTKEECVKIWALKQVNICPFINALVSREGRIPFKSVISLVKHLFTIWNNNTEERFSELLVEGAISQSWAEAGLPLNGFRFLESTTGKFAHLPLESIPMTISPLASLNKIGPCLCYVCMKKSLNTASTSLDSNDRKRSLECNDEDSLIVTKKSSNEQEKDTSYHSFDQCRSNALNLSSVSPVVYGTKNAGRWSCSPGLFCSLISERIFLCKSRDYFKLKSVRLK